MVADGEGASSRRKTFLIASASKPFQFVISSAFLALTLTNIRCLMQTCPNRRLAQPQQALPVAQVFPESGCERQNVAIKNLVCDMVAQHSEGRSAIATARSVACFAGISATRVLSRRRKCIEQGNLGGSPTSYFLAPTITRRAPFLAHFARNGPRCCGHSSESALSGKISYGCPRYCLARGTSSPEESRKALHGHVTRICGNP